MSEWLGRHRVWFSHPTQNVLNIAAEVRLRFGHGGANFPGAAELYEAARKIEEWNADCEAQRERSQAERERWAGHA